MRPPRDADVLGEHRGADALAVGLEHPDDAQESRSLSRFVPTRSPVRLHPPVAAFRAAPMRPSMGPPARLSRAAPV